MRKLFRPGAAVVAALAVSCQAGAMPEPGSETLLVMLQDEDLDPVRSAVLAAGGSITHDLPIIHAIGARMTRAQLNAVQRVHPDIGRVIDDLAWTPEPEPPGAGDCTLAGAIELAWSDSEATWTLFNKGPTPLVVQDLELSWPQTESGIVRLAAGDKVLAQSTAGMWELRAPLDLTIAPKNSAAVTLEVIARPENPRLIQRDIVLRATADRRDCVARLVPSYGHPAQDSYYPTVTGAALLHSYGITGEGVTVAVLDSGLWESPAQLSMDASGRARIVARFDAIEGQVVDEALDESGHGTHITSVIARSDAVTRADASSPSYRGVAPNVDVVVVKAFGESGEAGFLDIVRGIQWVVSQRDRLGIRVLNLSFAARPRWPYWEDPVNQALMRAWQAGIFVVAAAGNEGPEPMSIGSPGNLPYLLTVGAVTDSWTETDRSDDYIPDFSSRGPTPLGHIKPDLVAPGGHIAGITRPGSTLARDFPEYFLSTGEFVMTGSSQAAAVVSGLAALLLELDPDLGNDELKCMLKTTAEPAIDIDGRLAYSPFTQGDGLVSLLRAVTIGAPTCDQQDLDLKADITGRDHFRGPAIFQENAPPTLPGADRLIAAPPPAEGPSATRRWGAAEHLERLTAPPSDSPIDWPAIHADEQARIRALAKPTP